MNYNCPLCGAALVESLGNQIHPGDKNFGVMLHCPAHECSAQEVMGHGKDAKDAMEVITEKYKKHE